MIRRALLALALLAPAFPAGAQNIIYGKAGTPAAQVLTVQGIASMTALKVDGSAVTQPVSGTVTSNQGGAPWSVGGNVASGATDSGNPVKVGGIFNASPITLTDGQRGDAQLDASGFLKVNVAAGGASGGTSSSFSAAFPATGTAIGAKNGSNMVNLTADGSNNLNVNCATGCAGASDSTATGTVTAVNNAVTVSSAGRANVGAIVTANTNVTLIFEGSVDGTNWVTVNGYPVGGGASITSTASGGTGSWVIPSGGLANVRARVTAVGATPTATVSLEGGAGPSNVVTVVSPTAANLNATVSGTVTVTQSTASSLKVDLSGTAANATAIKVDGSAVTQPVSGTVTANIGTSGSLALDASVTGLQVSQGSTTSGQKGGLALGAVTTAAPTYTTAQTSPLSLTTAGALRVDGSAVTQPVSISGNQAVNVAQINGVTPLMGNGVTGTGSQRVTIASDNSAVSGLGAAATAAAVPANAVYQGVNVGGNLTGEVGDACQTVAQTSTTINISTATTTRIVAPVSAKKTYICGLTLFAAGADNVGVVEGTGGTCGTGTAGVIGGTTAATGFNFVANQGFVLGAGKVAHAVTAGTNVDLCLITSAAVQLTGVVKWSQQ